MHKCEPSFTLTPSRHGGNIPNTVEGLKAIPGIGDYTAGAVASIAFNVQVCLRVYIHTWLVFMRHIFCVLRIHVHAHVYAGVYVYISFLCVCFF